MHYASAKGSAACLLQETKLNAVDYLDTPLMTNIPRTLPMPYHLPQSGMCYAASAARSCSVPAPQLPTMQRLTALPYEK